MSDYITITDSQHGINVELYPKGNTIDVYVGSSKVGEIGANTLSAVASSDNVVIPDNTYNTEN